MTTFTRGKAKKPSVSDIHGGPILNAISIIRRNAFEIYERTHGPTLMTETTDSQLGIDGIIDDLNKVLIKYREVEYDR